MVRPWLLKRQDQFGTVWIDCCRIIIGNRIAHDLAIAIAENLGEMDKDVAVLIEIGMEGEVVEASLEECRKDLVFNVEEGLVLHLTVLDDPDDAMALNHINAPIFAGLKSDADRIDKPVRDLLELDLRIAG